MGNRIAGSTNPFAREPLVCSTCICDAVFTITFEKRRIVQTAGARTEAEDIMFLLTHKRRMPRNLLGQINFAMYVCVFEVFPTLCCPLWPASIMRKLAFRPPDKPTYSLVPFGPPQNKDYRLVLKPPAAYFLRILYRRCQGYTGNLRCFYLEGRNESERIACIYARALAATTPSKPITILYSHSNSMDLGFSVGYIVFLARRLRADVFAYDYLGYGCSGGTCSEKTLYSSVERVYDFLTNTLKVPGEQIVAFGTSLGTAATIHLVSSTTRQVKAVVLQGSFMSACRVLCPKQTRTLPIDQFVNIDKINRVTQPTLFIHGHKDLLFGLNHAQSLRQACPGAANVQPLFLVEGGHTDFEDFVSYWRRLHEFLHQEVFTSSPTEACCTYHPVDIRRRQLRMLDEQASTRGVAEPIVICEECLKIEKISASTFSLTRHQSRRSSRKVSERKEA